MALTKEDLEKAITIPGITDNTDYIKTAGKALASGTDDILERETKRLIAEQDKEIDKITKKYNSILSQLGIILDNSDMTKAQREQILLTMGYYDEIKPYLETKESLERSLKSRSRVLQNPKA